MFISKEFFRRCWESKKIRFCTIILLALLIFVLSYSIYKKQQEIRKINQLCVSISVKSEGRISVKTCKEWIKNAGGLEKFYDLIRNIK